MPLEREFSSSTSSIRFCAARRLPTRPFSLKMALAAPLSGVDLFVMAMIASDRVMLFWLRCSSPGDVRDEYADADSSPWLGMRANETCRFVSSSFATLLLLSARCASSVVVPSRKSSLAPASLIWA